MVIIFPILLTLMFDSGIILWEKLDASQFVSVINDLPIAKKTPQKIENTVSLLIMQKGIMNVVENRI